MRTVNVPFKQRTVGKSIPLHALTGPEGPRRLRLPDSKNSRHIEMVRLPALRTGRLYPPRNIPGTHFCQRLSRPQGHSAAGRIMSMENMNDTIGNRTRDLPAGPQPTTPPCATPHIYWVLFVIATQCVYCEVWMELSIVVKTEVLLPFIRCQPFGAGIIFFNFSTPCI